MQCVNYDLCMTCEASLIHPDHFMLRIPIAFANKSDEEIMKQYLGSGTSKKDLEEKTCKVCWDYDANMCMIPCGHLICLSCGNNAVTEEKCPFCQQKVSNLQKVYMP